MNERLTEIYGETQKIFKIYELCHGKDFIKKLAEDGPFQSTLGFTLRATLNTNSNRQFLNHRPIRSQDEFIVGYMFPSYNGNVKLYVNDMRISDVNVTAGVIYAPVFDLFWYPIRDLKHISLQFYNFTNGTFDIETEPFYIISLHDEKFDNTPTKITHIVNKDKSLLMRFWYPRTDNLTIYTMGGPNPEYLDNHSMVLDYPYRSAATIIQRICRKFLERKTQKATKPLPTDSFYLKIVLHPLQEKSGRK
jgi:hypothetical protein